MEQHTSNGEVSSGVTEEWVEVTPQMAAEWLLLNTRNRPIRRAAVVTYASDMANGDWDEEAGDPVRFATQDDGTELLIDGQHRCMAVVRAKKTIRMKVRRGLSPRTQRYIDIGNRRQLGDQLGIEGHEHSKSLSALARRIHAWQTTGSPNMRASGVSQPQLRRVLIDPETEQVYPLIAAAAEYAHRHPKGLVPASGLGFLFWLLTPLDADLAVTFLDRADDGAGLVKDGNGYKDPILAWRDKLIDYRSSGVKLSDHVAIAYGVLAWNHWVRGKKVVYLRAPAGGMTGKKFPQPNVPPKRS